MENVIEYLERLVLVSFTEEEKKKLVKEIDKILEYFRRLNEIPDLDKYEPLFYVHDIAGPAREDEIDTRRIISREDLERNAVIEQGYVKAPRTVVD